MAEFNNTDRLLAKYMGNLLSVFIPASQIAVGSIIKSDKEKISEGNLNTSGNNKLKQISALLLCMGLDFATTFTIGLSILNKKPDFLSTEVEAGTGIVKLGLICAALWARRRNSSNSIAQR